jgi:hypothetical protein
VDEQRSAAIHRFFLIANDLSDDQEHNESDDRDNNEDSNNQHPSENIGVTQ